MFLPNFIGRIHTGPCCCAMADGGCTTTGNHRGRQGRKITADRPILDCSPTASSRNWKAAGTVILR
jgi:hypothetical protein